MKNYFYIDESGDLSPIDKGGSQLFILGCVITTSPQQTRQKISALKKELLSKAFYSRHYDQLKRTGFHAVENHLDIYARFLEMLVALDFRAYVLFVRKNYQKYKSQLNKKTRKEIYDQFLYALLRDRLLKRRYDQNIIVIEQNLPKQTSASLSERKKEVEKIIRSINTDLKTAGLITKDILTEIRISTKAELLLSVTDYINHVVLKAYAARPYPYEKKNLKLLESKIGLIYDVFKKSYYSPRKTY